MPVDHRKVLAGIKRLDQLIAYLRDEMGWPIARDSFEDVDDLFYDFTAEELGIDPETAPKIETIKRLRPLSPKQPWGIFFVKFATGKLPVVALRRILSRVALKKRPSANSAERAAWTADDLLFVSNYGEGDERQISFAHFLRAQDGHDLPTLKVLGWNNRDTALHLDAVARELSEQLVWPDDDSNAGAWRARWRAAFTLRHREVITTSKALSVRLAGLARDIRDRINTALAIETDNGPLTKLMKAFQEALVHDLDANGFADMYAQTIAYGLLSARITDPTKKTADDFAGHLRTNPFLRELMETFLRVGGRRGKAGGPGIDFDELGVSEVVELLDDANMEAVVRDFGDRNPQEDPVIHFYQDFLQAYDSHLRVKRGVFYTPRPVVSYIVRSVDELLRTAFGLPDGLADTTTWGEMAERHQGLKVPESVPPEQDFVQILDPATGTGTFLVEVIDLIYKTLVAKWQTEGKSEAKIDALWNEYVPKHLLARLHGYELLMAPYAIAHLKIGLKLYETGYRFRSDERTRIYLTNALEPAADIGQQPLGGMFPAIAHEAQAVDEVKRNQRFTVVVGNPPYSIMSANLSLVCRGLVDPFRSVDGAPVVEKSAIVLERTLQDDYVKFYGLADKLLGASGAGLVGLISNSSFLENINLRGMRWRLLVAFDQIYVFDLHGDSDRREVDASGEEDANVFDIKKGVAIFTALKRPGSLEGRAVVDRADLLGTRTHKYRALLGTSILQGDFVRIVPRPNLYSFIASDALIADEFARGIPISRLFVANATGIETGKDSILVALDHDSLRQRLMHFGDSSVRDSEIRKEFDAEEGCGRTIADLRKSIPTDPDFNKRLLPFAFAPFDTRWVFYRKDAINVHSYEVCRHLRDGKNVTLLAMRQVILSKGFTHVFVTRNIANNRAFYSTRGKAYMFPLWLRDSSDELQFAAEGRRPNVSDTALSALASGKGGREALPERIMAYVYAITHSPTYRSRYDGPLRSDYPSVPASPSAALFEDLVQLGGELIALHLMESPKLDDFITTYTGTRNSRVGRVGWSDDTVWLDAAATRKGQPATPGTIGFRGVPEYLWKFHIGGYQVCQKWLKDRKGRTLTAADIAHYQRIVVALSETTRIMKEIDERVEAHGGWPGAFQAGDVTTASATDIPTAKQVAPTYQGRRPPVRKVAERLSEGSGEDGPDTPVEDDRSADLSSGLAELETRDLMCLTRTMFATGGARDRETAIRDLAESAGHKRVGARVRETADNAVRTAARRGILENENGQLSLLAQSIDGYGRDFLKEQFLASLEGYDWTERDEAIVRFARWMGFKRTGGGIKAVAKSLINGLLREERLVSEGTMIRRVLG